MTKVPLENLPLNDKHLEAAAQLVSLRYQKLLEQVPCLPTRYANPNAHLPLLEDIAENGSGVAALENGTLAGFLAAWKLPDFRDKLSTYSPEWAHAVEEPGGRRFWLRYFQPVVYSFARQIEENIR